MKSKKNFHSKSLSYTRLADSDTPVSIYLKLRDSFAETLLMEHSEDVGHPGYSYICCDPIAGVLLDQNTLTMSYPNGEIHSERVGATQNLVGIISDYIQSFTTDRENDKFDVNGFFGYFNYNSVRHFEDVAISDPLQSTKQIPDIRLNFYRYVIVFNHFTQEITIIHFYTDEQSFKGIEAIEKILCSRYVANYSFTALTEEQSNVDDNTFLEMVEKGRAHCLRGDVFQIVLSREFEVSFQGDEFNVYRRLRSINPSQYMFYFDYGSYRLLGSSPEAQLRIHNKKAIIHPIAGTYRRSGDEERDKVLIAELLTDTKENSEHVMLVDLARNDLSKTFQKVEIPSFKTIKSYSHVLHMVSKVTGEEPISELNAIKVFADTFPAGTLSGAPKHRAMQLIEEYEGCSRGFYGGSIGYIGIDGSCNQAIMIRSFLSKNNKLHYRAGAGIVAASVPSGELAEVNNKIAALRKAIENANTPLK